MNLKDLAVDHDYYCSDSNYYSNEASLRYETWEDFYAEFHDVDVDMNLVFRFDVSFDENEGHFYMNIFQMKQRIGVFSPIHIESIKEENLPEIQAYLQPHFEKLKSIWQPFE